MLAFSAGIIFFTCAFLIKIPQGVCVNGICVGGKSYADAARAVRSAIEDGLKEKSLTVRGREQDYVFTYPEIGYRDDLQTILKTAQRNGEYTVKVSYYLNGLSEVTANICGDESIPVVEPYAVFNKEGEPFTYFEGNDGERADRLKLIEDLRRSLSGGFEDVTISFKKVFRMYDIKSVRYDTRLLSTFTTRFDGSNSDRSHNIALACEKINGAVLENGQGFSFNNTVGARTTERGFRPAKIISDGQFVDGIGGGVCQVSTTLFNAALLAGCSITEFHPHSLAVSYVPPSFDAMVSGNYFDLKFENTTGYRLYIRARTDASSVTFDVYGRGDGASYGYSSVVTGSIAAPEEKTDDLSLVREGRDGTLSEGYLTVRRNGISKTILFRKDKYSPVKRITADIPEIPPIAENDETSG